MGLFSYLFGMNENMGSGNDEESVIRRQLYAEGRQLCAKKKYEQAYAAFGKAVQLGDPSSCRMCGMMSYIGLGTKKNKRRGLTLLKKAVDLDKDLSCCEFVFWDFVENNLDNEDFLSKIFCKEVISKTAQEQEEIRQKHIIEDKEAAARKLCESGLKYCVSEDYERAFLLFKKSSI